MDKMEFISCIIQIPHTTYMHALKNTQSYFKIEFSFTRDGAWCRGGDSQ